MKKMIFAILLILFNIFGFGQTVQKFDFTDQKMNPFIVIDVPDKKASDSKYKVEITEVKIVYRGKMYNLPLPLETHIKTAYTNISTENVPQYFNTLNDDLRNYIFGNTKDW